MDKNILILYFCSIFACLIYLLGFGNFVENDVDFMFWILPAICMVIVPVAIVKIGRVVKNG